MESPSAPRTVEDYDEQTARAERLAGVTYREPYSYGKFKFTRREQLGEHLYLFSVFPLDADIGLYGVNFKTEKYDYAITRDGQVDSAVGTILRIVDDANGGGAEIRLLSIEPTDTAYTAEEIDAARQKLRERGVADVDEMAGFEVLNAYHRETGEKFALRYAGRDMAAVRSTILRQSFARLLPEAVITDRGRVDFVVELPER